MAEWVNSKELLLNEISLINKTVLDVGCGDGWFCYWCLNYGCRVDGIDPSEDQINIARNKRCK